jgi:predicted nuclease of restriction endonuclease-like RecB superfamily
VRNKFELRINKELRKTKLDYGYETERIPYILAKHYVPDFILETELGKVYVECKGYLRPEDKTKLAAVKKQHPELDIRIVFYGDRTAREKQQIKWAIRKGFRYAVHAIPEEWIHGL